MAKEIDYNKVAKKITDVSTYNERLAELIAKNPGTLGEGLVTKIGQDASVINRIWTGLQDNTTFAKTLFSSLTDDAAVFRGLLKGDKGAVGEIAASKDALKENLYDKIIRTIRIFFRGIYSNVSILDITFFYSVCPLHIFKMY